MLLAIVPAYNEEKRIGSVVRDLLCHVDTVVVVNDASKDNTVQQAKNAGAVVLSHKINRGQGAALETGHEFARRNGYEYVLHFDGDGQFHVDDIHPALQHMKKEQADILFGSRFLADTQELPWSKKYIILPLGKFLHELLGVQKLSDVHNGFRILSQNAFHIIRVSQDRMAHATEIPAQATKHQLRIVEYPVRVSYHEYGQGITGGFLIIKDLFLGNFIKK